MQCIKDILRKAKRHANALVGRDVIYRPEVRCTKERHGTEYGGWIICPTNMTKDSIVYSCGVGEDISFDLSLIKKYAVTVYAFDPTPRSIQWVKSHNLPPQFRLLEFGVSDYDGVAHFYPPENPDHISHSILERPSSSQNAIEVKVHRFILFCRLTIPSINMNSLRC